MKREDEVEGPEVLLGCLQNGAQFIGKVVGRTAALNGSQPEELKFVSLVGLQYQQVGKDSIGIGFIPFCIAAEDEPISLFRRDILFLLPAPNKVREQYLAFMSPIIQARAIPTMGLVKPS